MRNQVKRIVLFIVAIVLMTICFVISVSAETYGDFEYVLEDGKAIITGYHGSDEELVIPSSVDDYDVIGIGTRAFNEVSTVKKIVIEEGVTYIDDTAFIRVGAREIILPDSITEIGKEAFIYCVDLENITLSQNLSSIGSCAFESCYKLREIILPDSLVYMGGGAFKSSGLEKITLSNNLEAIYSLTFSFCSELREIVIPENVKIIGRCAFESCSSLNKVTFLGNVEEIQEGAFSHCNSLENILLPDSVTKIEKQAFTVCNSLAEITIPSKIEVIKESTFEGCSSLSKVVVPESVKKIEYRAFSMCTNLKFFDFKNVEEIEEQAFVNCEALEQVVFGSNLKKIGKKAFLLKLNMDPIYVCYGGNEVQWKAVSGSNKNGPMNMGIHYNFDKDHLTEMVLTKANLINNGNITRKCKVCEYECIVEFIDRPYIFSLEEKSYSYDGSVKTPTVCVLDLGMRQLEEGTDYIVSYESGRKKPGKYGVTITFLGNLEGQIVLYFSILPGKTSKLVASQTNDTITLKWRKVEGATGYRVYQYNSKTKKYDKLKNTSGTSYTVKKLKAGTTYNFAVKAYSKVDGEVIWADSYKTLKTATKPATPTVKVTAGTKKATLSWNKVTGATGYVIYMRNSDGSYEKVGTTKKTSYTVSGLSYGEKCYFRVRAYKTVDGKNIYGGFKTYSATVPFPAVYVTPYGKRYHYDKECAGKNAIKTTLSNAKKSKTPCRTCVI